jgi:molybdopterin molybdotransferase
MISVTEARQRLLDHIPAPTPATLPLAEANGYVLAEDVYSPLDMPSFAQSAMDGYALHFNSLQPGQPLPVVHIIQAGATDLPPLQPGQAMRIFTGAPVPPGADTVVMQEKVEVQGSTILLKDPDLTEGANVRPQASQTAKGDLAAKAGLRLSPGSIGLLAGLGIQHVQVFKNPDTAILVTGKELVKPGQPLQMGQVYESNSVTLRAALAEGGIRPTMTAHVDDEPELIYQAVVQALSTSQLVLITGGISVGDYDFVQGALQKAGVEPIFYKIKQKPGKPLYVGIKGNTLVFGLPGNPGSVLSCFYQYVVPAIRRFKGLDATTAQSTYKALTQGYSKKPGLTHFIKGIYKGDTVSITRAQESYKLSAFTESNCLVELPEEQSEFATGEAVRIYPLNQVWL